MITLTLLFWMETNLSSSPAFDGEPVVAVNPLNTDNVVVAWLRAALGRSYIAVRYTMDGGETWSDITLMPHLYAGFNSADPALAFSSNGTVYLAYIDFEQSSSTGYVLFTSSRDGGATWSTPRIAVSYDEAEDYPIDRPWITAGGDTIYMTTIETAILGATAPYHIFFKRSTDGGNTWSPLMFIGEDACPPGWLRSMGQLSASGDTVFLAYYSYAPDIHPLPGHIISMSFDAGETFEYGIIDRLDPSFAVDSTLKKGTPLLFIPHSHLLIATRVGSDFGDPDILYYTSADMGATWQGPLRMNDDPQGNGAYQDMPWGCSRDSIVAFFWRDRRGFGTGFRVPFDIYGIISTDGGITFGPGFRVNSQPSLYDSLLLLRGNDFLGCDVGDDEVFVVWGDTRDTSMHIDIYLARIPLPLAERERIQHGGRGAGTFDPSGRKTSRGKILIDAGGEKVIRIH